MQIRPKNWEDHQHYKDRKPQWIKLHRDLLNDYSYSLVQIGTKATLPLLWLLSCEYEDGVIDATIEEISFRIRINKSTVQTAIDELLDGGWYTLVQNGTDCLPREEKRREEKSVYKSSVFNVDEVNSILDYRKSIKAPIKSKQGYTGLENKIIQVMEKYKYTLIQVLEIMGSREWKSVEVDWIERTNPIKAKKKEVLI